MEHISIIVVAGPAGGGKSIFANHLATARDLPQIATDDYRQIGWEDVPFAVGEDLLKFDEPGSTVILEGVRALSVIKHCGLAARVTELYWCDEYPEKPKTKGLTTRQRNLLAEMKESLPVVRRPGESAVPMPEPIVMGQSRIHTYDFSAMLLAAEEEGASQHPIRGHEAEQVIIDDPHVLARSERTTVELDASEIEFLADLSDIKPAAPTEPYWAKKLGESMAEDNRKMGRVPRALTDVQRKGGKGTP